MIKFKQKKFYREVPISEELISKYKSKDNLLRHLDSKDSGIMLIDNLSNKLIGYIAWDNNVITALEVLDDYKGNGFSSKLLKIAEENGCNELTVNSSNKHAISVYEHLGWKFYKPLGPKMLVYIKN